MNSDYENGMPNEGKGGYNNSYDRSDRDPLFSRSIKAGKRVYYLDVKRDRRGEYYVAMTESRRVQDGTETERPVFEKHKIFLYREDILSFLSAFAEAAKFVGENRPLTAHERRPYGSEERPYGERRPYNGGERRYNNEERPLDAANADSEERAFGLEEAPIYYSEESSAPSWMQDTVEPEVRAENDKKPFFGRFDTEF